MPRSVLLDLALSAPPWDGEDEDAAAATPTGERAALAASRSRRKTTRK